MTLNKTTVFSLLALAFALNLSAASLTSDQLRMGLSTNSFSSTLTTLSKDTSDDDELWYWLNLARLQQVNGDFNDSIHSYESAYAILDEYENRAKVSIRNIGSFLGSALLSKGSETYYGKGYERTLMHTLNALNYAMLGDFEGAAVEMRRMEQRQEFWLKESQEKLKEAADEKSKALKYGSNPDVIPNGYSMASMLQDDDVRNLANNYQDPFSYTLSSIISSISNAGEAAGSEAQISLKRAIALNPDVTKAFVTLPETPKKATKSSLPLPNGTKNKKTAPMHERAVETGDESAMEVVVIVLAGEAPSLKIDKVRFPIFHAAEYTSIDLPAYTPAINDVNRVTLTTSELILQPPRLLKTNAMAYKTLKDELPGNLAKAVSRAAVKAVMAKQMSDKYGAFAGLATSLLMDTGSSFADSAYRNWETLPNSGFLSKFKAKKGEKLTMILNNQQEIFTLPSDKTGVIVMVSYLTPDNIRIDHVSY